MEPHFHRRFAWPERMNISDEANAYARKACVLRVNRRLPWRVSFLSLSIDHVLHLPPAHRMKEKNEGVFTGACNDIIYQTDPLV